MVIFCLTSYSNISPTPLPSASTLCLLSTMPNEEVCVLTMGASALTSTVSVAAPTWRVA
jgi:hypothetical protein